DAAEARLANPVHLEQTLRRALDHVENLLAKRCDKPAGQLRTNSADHPGPKIAPDAIDRRGRHYLQESRAELQPMLTVLLPLPTRLNALPGMHLDRRTKHRHELTMSLHLDAEHAESRLGAMEGDALHKPGQRLPTTLLVWYGFSHGSNARLASAALELAIPLGAKSGKPCPVNRVPSHAALSFPGSLVSLAASRASYACAPWPPAWLLCSR